MHPVTLLAIAMILIAIGIAVASLDVKPAIIDREGGVIKDFGRWYLMHDGKWKPVEGPIV
jgi:hypothetical protein